MTTGVDNSVVIKDSDGYLKTDEIDSRVWGSTLVDATNGSNNRIPTFTDSNTITGEISLTFDAATNTLGVGGDITAVDLYAEGEITHKPQGAGNISGTYTNLLISDWDTLFFTYIGGNFLRVGTAITPTAGNLYNLGSSGWVAADADGTSTSTGFLGIAITSSSSNTFLTEGYVLITNYTGTPTLGAPVYVDTTAGSFAFTAPSGSGDVVRIVGHCVDKYVSGRDERPIIRFNPSNDWIELT
jgi:hypothetical protein